GGLLAVCLLTLIALPGWSQGQKNDRNNQAPPAAEKAPPDKNAAHADPLAAKLFDNVAAKAGVALVNQDSPPAATKQTEQDKKLRELEAKLRALLEEVQTLRAAGKAPPGKTQKDPDSVAAKLFGEIRARNAEKLALETWINKAHTPAVVN